jgi:hypothetical protein
VYSLTIIIFELFSGIDPFPGHIGQIFQAKMFDKKPAIPSDFPAELKKLVFQGWSKDPKERPSIQEFKSAFNKMLPKQGKGQSPTLPEDNSPNEKEEKPIPCEEVDLAEKTKETLSTKKDAGNIFVDKLIGYFLILYYQSSKVLTFCSCKAKLKQENLRHWRL